MIWTSVVQILDTSEYRVAVHTNSRVSQYLQCPNIYRVPIFTVHTVVSLAKLKLPVKLHRGDDSTISKCYRRLSIILTNRVIYRSQHQRSALAACFECCYAVWYPVLPYEHLKNNWSLNCNERNVALICLKLISLLALWQMVLSIFATERRHASPFVFQSHLSNNNYSNSIISCVFTP